MTDREVAGSWRDHEEQLCGGLFAGCPHCDEERARRIKAETAKLPQEAA